jgi:hypothetical protein
MSSEPKQLLAARQHLSRAEAQYGSVDGLYYLEEGLALLEEVIAGSDAGASRIAGNLLTTYATKIYAVAERAVETDPNLPEPQLEHLFKLILAFDQVPFELPVEARKTKVALVRRLIDRYLEGYPAESKLAVLEKLKQVSGGGEALRSAPKSAGARTVRRTRKK